MKKKDGALFSRREFAQRAAMLSATASLVSAEAILPKVTLARPAQDGQAGPKLSAAGQAEAEARYQQVLTLHGDRLDETQKTNVKKMCNELQPMLERIRSFPLQNGDSPALYLKPLVEREKKPQAAAEAGGKKS
ncbi:MAG TPA: hypothetical protein VEI54_02455 [Candidatus Limnocylindrales bacterium]|nr:hypothetical protein [Candidatus Limnocylindrales bacterium]